MKKRPKRRPRRNSAPGPASQPGQSLASRGPLRSTLVEIEKPVYGGEFLARESGKAIFVPLSLPGECVRVEVIEERRGFARAEISQVVSPSDDRVQPQCRYFGECGGCQYQHTSYPHQVELKKEILRETLDRGGVRELPAIETLTAQPWEYRNRIRLAIDADGNVGYRARKSHRIVPIDECPIAAPVLMKAAHAYTQAAPALRLRANELTLFCNADESELLATITASNASAQGLAALVEEWRRDLKALKGVACAKPDWNESAKPELIWGEVSLQYPAGGAHYRVDHGAFFQVNRFLVDEFVEKVTAELSGETLWDLYAGVGLFARKLSNRFTEVCAVESAPAAMAALRENLTDQHAKVIAADTLEFLRHNPQTRPDAIVVDPPRSGLGSEVTALLAKTDAPQLVYVSCDPATLARDLKAFTGAGYSIESLTLADMFPQTFHVESIVHLRKN